MPNREMFDWDYYSILGVKPDATTAEIKSAWRQLQKIVHPDRAVPGDEADRKNREETSKRVNNAWQVLGNEKTRREYDAYRARQGRTAPAPGPATPPRRPRGPRPGNIDIDIDIEDLLRGARSRPSRTGGHLTNRSPSPTGRDGAPATSLPGGRAPAPTPTPGTSLPYGRAPAARTRPTTGRVPRTRASGLPRRPSRNGSTSTSTSCCATCGAGGHTGSPRDSARPAPRPGAGGAEVEPRLRASPAIAAQRPAALPTDRMRPRGPGNQPLDDPGPRPKRAVEGYGPWIDERPDLGGDACGRIRRGSGRSSPATSGPARSMGQDGTAPATNGGRPTTATGTRRPTGTRRATGTRRGSRTGRPPRRRSAARDARWADAGLGRPEPTGAHPGAPDAGIPMAERNREKSTDHGSDREEPARPAEVGTEPPRQRARNTRETHRKHRSRTKEIRPSDSARALLACTTRPQESTCTRER